jgi:hypothetical protein
MTTNDARDARISAQLMRAAISKFEADRQEALAVIELYLNSSVGIGDHPTVVSELCTAVTNLADSEDALQTIQRNFLDAPAETPPDNE